MTLSARDRKILIVVGLVAIPLAYWLLLLSPKRAEQSKLQNQLTQARSAEQSAAQNLASLNAAKRSFANDYATVIRLGKSIPASLDMASLLFQLDAAAGGNGIVFSNVTSGARSSQPGAASTPSSTAGATSTAASASSTTSVASNSGVQGLDSVPITFEFDGSFFDLASFFHQIKRFVQLQNNQLVVSGRLITINNLEFKLPTNSGPQTNPSMPRLTATVGATVYLAPKSQGVAAGATPSGPAGTGSSTATPVSGSSTPSAAPAAAALTR